MKSILSYKPILVVMLLLASIAPALAQGSAKYNLLANDQTALWMTIAILFAVPFFYTMKTLITRKQRLISMRAKTVLALVAMGLFGANSAYASAFSDFTTTSWVLVATIIFLVLLISSLFSQYMEKTTEANILIAQEESEKTGTRVEPKGFWADLWFRLNKFRPMEEESEIETQHIFDGIKELDNATPPWFTIGFLGSIVIAIIYFWVHHISMTAPLQIEEYEREVAIAEAKLAEYLSKQTDVIDENTVTLFTDDFSISNGKKTFDANCVACHKADGGGSVGPNLTDEYWIHGGSVKDIFSTIKYGVIEKGMIPWKDELSARQMAELVAYIYTLQGTNPPGAKEAEGEKYTPDVEVEEATEEVAEEVSEEETTEA